MRETPEYADMMRRMIRRYGERVADADPVDLTTMVEIRASFDDAVEVAVVGLVAEGFSWREVGEALGITRQAAWQRYGRAASRQQRVDAEIADTVTLDTSVADTPDRAPIPDQHRAVS